jgi:hypothetical protein
MNASGIDVANTLQIEGLTKNTNIESLNDATDADVQKMFDELIGFLNTDWESEKQKQRDLAQSAMFNYDITQNASAISGQSSSGGTGFENANEYADTLITRGEVMLAQAISAGVEGEAVEAYRENLAQLEQVINTEADEATKLKMIEDINFGSET